MSKTEGMIRAGLGAILAPAAPILGPALGTIFGPGSGGGQEASAPPQPAPQGSLQNPETARALGQELEREAAASRGDLRQGMQDTQRDVLQSGRQSVGGVSDLDPTVGTFHNAKNVVFGGSNSPVDGLAESAEEHGLGDKGSKPR